MYFIIFIIIYDLLISVIFFLLIKSKRRLLILIRNRNVAEYVKNILNIIFIYIIFTSKKTIFNIIYLPLLTVSSISKYLNNLSVNKQAILPFEIESRGSEEKKEMLLMQSLYYSINKDYKIIILYNLFKHAISAGLFIFKQNRYLFHYYLIFRVILFIIIDRIISKM